MLKYRTGSTFLARTIRATMLPQQTMSPWEYEHRCRLKKAYRKAQEELQTALERPVGESTGEDVTILQVNLELAQLELEAWEEEVTQVSSPPVGMVAVFERRDGMEEVIPVSYMGLQRCGRVVPYIYVGNCESKIPTQFPNFLRIDFNHLMGRGEVAPTEVMADLTERVREEDVAWSVPQ